ncbi:polysaccharide deacetylase family protein [Streptomyces sp. NPDC006879]|uniref:polysaccharide deacetylase family protein n=1 Tax=Streptomyces sp. NPDC006879 TaxID=3364767 RepID=UPI0036B5AC72
MPRRNRNRIALTVATAMSISAVLLCAAALAPGSPRPVGAKEQADSPAPAPARAGSPARAVVSESIVHRPEVAGRAVNLTLDDGPDPRWTPQVLDLLGQNSVKATFCLVGPQAERHPHLVRRIVSDGHRLCDHSMSHDVRMDQKPVPYQSREILDARQLIENASGGAPVLYYRAPGGAFTPDSRKIAAGAGMRPLGWNIDTKDFEKPGTSAIVRTVRQGLEGRQSATILFHDGGGDRHQTVEALRRLIPWIKEQGYAFSFPQV